jgi:hypothetical protein
VGCGLDPNSTRRWLIVGRIALLLAAAVATVGAAGGLRAAPEHPIVGPGVAVDQGLYRTTALRASARPALVYGYDAARDELIDERGVRVDVMLRVTNLSGQFQGLHDIYGGPSYMSGVGTRWPDGVRPLDDLGVARAHVAESATMSATLQPHRPTLVEVHYRLRAGMPAPKQLRVGLAEFEYVEDPMVDPRGDWSVVAKRYRRVRISDPVTGKLRRNRQTGTPLTREEPVPRTAAEVRVPVEWTGAP